MMPKSRSPKLPSQFQPPPTIYTEEVSRSGDTSIDKYTAGIELSNACRQFYVSRVKASAKVKERLRISGSRTPTREKGLVPSPPTITRTGTGSGCPTLPTTTTPLAGTSINKPDSRTSHRSPIDTAMQLLKREMASLIDQDLALMGQLLTLNEQIEELKWRRKLRGYSARGSLESSCTLDISNYSMCTSSQACTSNLEVRDYIPKYPSPSDLSLYTDPSPQGSCDLDLLEVTPSCITAGNDIICQPEPTTSTSDLGSSEDFVGSRERFRTPHVDLVRNERTGSLGQALNKSGNAQKSQATTGRVHHSRGSQGQQSFDSGIHDPEQGQLVEIIL